MVALKVPFLSERAIADRAGELLAGYARRTRKPLDLPVPIDKVIDHVLDIPVLWAPIPPQDDGEILVSKITSPAFGRPPIITLNEDLQETLFRTCPGLEQTALAHETGHALFHIDHGHVHQLPLGLKVEVAPAAFVSNAESLMERLRVFLRTSPGANDKWWREWQANTFMRHVLMPRSLLLPLLDERELRTWPGLYRLRERCQVTISALMVHLEKLDIVRVDDDRRIHLLTAAARDQGSLPF